MSKGQSWILFLLFFLGTLGVLSVDRAYGDLMDKEPELCLSMRRVNDETIKISLLGKTEKVDMDKVRSVWSDLEFQVADTLDGAVAAAKDIMGLEDGEGKEEEPFQAVDLPVQTL